MTYRILADLVMLAHFGFVVFVALGAFLLLWKSWIAWLHVPCVLYGAAIEFLGWICPLTPLEQKLRRLAGTAGYETGFLDHYLGGLLYPANWTSIHMWLGALVIAVNLLLYWRILGRP
ncbi:MAG: DUF2784 domain-containing protein [Gemmatimonadota bacterium]